MPGKGFDHLFRFAGQIHLFGNKRAVQFALEPIRPLMTAVMEERYWTLEPSCWGATMLFRSDKKLSDICQLVRAMSVQVPRILFVMEWSELKTPFTVVERGVFAAKSGAVILSETGTDTNKKGLR